MARKIRLRPGERLYVERAGIPGWLFWTILAFGFLAAIGPMGITIVFGAFLLLSPISRSAKLALGILGFFVLIDYLL